ncbi:GIY-YIG nuclease family protein [Celeribacter halophilus]|uniref:GIY-YIG domain-containing protein n=1 Tax=Celeribacter halophilus TaxID=576117 RepID=A0A1I3X537_9RHOB|nr:GIY-YIG nuclease family protein [Celeribacter halophilus]PZX03788.1 hypothetical protein LX82_03735 [Celeribacter halophilus]SFK14713.1 hypothetical protein SAMN04488138_1406 [Celeribacter halophilus]
MQISYVPCRDFYVYLHKKPDGEVFYVGKGRGVRAYDHDPRNKAWKQIVDECGDYVVEIARAGLLDDEARKLEAIMIKKYGRVVDGGTLTNSREVDDAFHWRKYYVTENLAEIQAEIDAMIKSEWNDIPGDLTEYPKGMPVAPFRLHHSGIIVDAAGREVCHPVDGEWEDDLSVASMICEHMNRAASASK